MIEIQNAYSATRSSIQKKGDVIDVEDHYQVLYKPESQSQATQTAEVISLKRTDTLVSVQSSTYGCDTCRICHCEAEPGAPLISPCNCLGSLKFVHRSCLQQWIKSANKKSCELCKSDFRITKKTKPFQKWQKLEMTSVERRKVICSVIFHIIAITCVVWSLFVLINRTTEEINAGMLEWPFWTKLIVVAIGFTGGLVFMYVQCKMYIQLCRRWRAYNLVIYIQDCDTLDANNAATIPLSSMLDSSHMDPISVCGADAQQTSSQSHRT